MGRPLQKFLYLTMVLLLFGCMTPTVKETQSSAETSESTIDPSLSDSAPIFPHVKSWREPEVHGVYVVHFGLQDCRQCHGQNFEGQAGPSCRNCHEVFPHPDAWVQEHKFKIRQMGSTAGCATKCHGTNLRGGLSQVDCAQCHKAYPHVANWREKHGAVAWETIRTQTVGHLNITPSGSAPLDNCTATCHKSTDSPSRPCWDCHRTNRHPENWRQVTEHSKKFAFQLPTTSNTTCMVCHGETYSGDAAPVACNQCHPFSHLLSWRQPQNHGVRYRNLEATNAIDCFSCHSAPIEFDKDYTGVNPAATPPPLCYQCHRAFPHIAYRHTNRRGETIVYPWSDPTAHVTLIMNNRNLLPGTDLDDPNLVNAIRNTCGNAGGCHTNGRFSNPQHGGRRAACSTVCHQ